MLEHVHDRYPPLSNTTFVILASFAAKAIAFPTSLAASTLLPFFNFKVCEDALAKSSTSFIINDLCTDVHI